MRKLLLATLAAMGASVGMAGAASLQTTQPSTEPGSVTFNLGGLVTFYAGVGSDTGSVITGTTPATTSAGGNVGVGKEQTFRTLSYVRLYPGVDGVLPNGIKWGAQFEIRMNSPSSTSGSPGTNTTNNTLYARRGYIYFGTPTAGTLRLGPHYGPSGLLITGNFEGFNDGGWNGDLPGIFTSNTQVPWPLPTQSALYSSNKIVYMSPNFFGVDAGISYAPSTNSFLGTENCASAAAGGCAYQSSSPTTTPLNAAGQLQPTEANRRKDMLEAAARYRGTFGPLGVAGNAAWIHAGHVNYTGVATPASITSYKDQNVGDFGLELTFAGFTVGGNFQFGQFGSSYSLVPSGGRNGMSWLAGAQYATGPFVVGASFYNFTYEGGYSRTVATGLRMDQGVAAGATYTLTPGVNLFASYLYGQRHESGYDFIAASATGTGLHNNVKAQGFSLGTNVKW